MFYVNDSTGWGGIKQVEGGWELDFASAAANHDLVEVYPTLSEALAALAVNVRVMEDRLAGDNRSLVATQADIEEATAKFFRDATYPDLG